MHIDEFRSQFGLSRSAVWNKVKRGELPPPRNRFGNPHDRYGPEHVAEMRAYLALKDNNTTLREVITLIKEDGSTLTAFVRSREEAIRRYGLTPAGR